MPTIPDRTIEEVRERSGHDLAEIVGADVDLQRAGSEFKACCPFHDEKTPSFYVIPRKGFYHCQGCGESGDAFRWLMERRNMPFADAVRQLAGRYGIVVPDADEPALRRPLSRRDKEMRSVMANLVDIAMDGADRAPPIATLDAEPPFSGTLPPLSDLLDRLRARGFTEAQLGQVGLGPETRASQAWAEGGPVIWAGDAEQVLAMRPLGDPRAPVVGVFGQRSGGWVGREGALRQARADGVVRLAADASVLRALRNRLGEAAQMPIGRVSQTATEAAVPISADPLVVTAAEGASRRRALRIALAVSEFAPRVGVVETDPESVDLERDYAGAIDRAGNVFEWQAKLLHAHGELLTEEGRTRAARRLAAIIDRTPATAGALERDVYADLLKKMTGFEYEDVRRDIRSEDEGGRQRAAVVRSVR